MFADTKVLKTKCTETRVLNKHEKVLRREKNCYTKANLQRKP